MTTTRTDPGRPTPSTAARVRDDRTFYRRALALVAPLPMLAMGLGYLLLDLPGDGKFSEMVDAAARQTDLLHVLHWTEGLFFAFLIPAVIAVAAVTRRRSPRLTAIGICLTVPGFALGFALLPNDQVLALLTHEQNLDVGSVGALDEAYWALPQSGLGALLFLVGIVIGLLLLGIALARSGAAPVWTGVALALGGFTHPFLPHHVVTGLGLFVAAAGFAGASWALWRMSNDDFAPPPFPRVRKGQGYSTGD